jgi:hypothetical protein
MISFEHFNEKLEEYGGERKDPISFEKIKKHQIDRWLKFKNGEGLNRINYILPLEDDERLKIIHDAINREKHYFIQFNDVLLNEEILEEYRPSSIFQGLCINSFFQKKFPEKPDLNLVWNIFFTKTDMVFMCTDFNFVFNIDEKYLHIKDLITRSDLKIPFEDLHSALIGYFQTSRSFRQYLNNKIRMASNLTDAISGNSSIEELENLI